MTTPVALIVLLSDGLIFASSIPQDRRSAGPSIGRALLLAVAENLAAPGVNDASHAVDHQIAGISIDQAFNR